jgi:putative transposase
VILVYRYRVKSLSGLLNRQSRAVNFVWNYCNDRQKDAIKWNKRWLSGFDLNVLTIGSSKELSLHSGTINAVCEQYAKSRQQHKRPWLRYRGKRALGWIPIKGRDLKRTGNAFRFAGNTFRVFYSRPLPAGKVKDCTNFSQDAHGNWYLNIVIEQAASTPREPRHSVGIDLGLKEFAVLSTGEKIGHPRTYRALEERVGKAQRAHKKRQITKLHAKIKNCRRDFLHKLSTRLIREFDYIAAGNVNASGLAKTSRAKSIYDAGWSSFRQMLAYKSVREGARYEEVDERFSTQTCSECANLGGPKGREGLVIREWVCSECGCEHDRDQNAALNLLLRSGHRTPGQGISARKGGDDVNDRPSQAPRPYARHLSDP